MGILKAITQWAIGPWGQSVPIHIAWFLIGVATAGLCFLVAHAIYIRCLAKADENEAGALPPLAVFIPKQAPRHSLFARGFHWVMAAAMLALIFTAFLPRLRVPFDWVTYHWVAGAVLAVSVIFNLVHASFWLDSRAIWHNKSASPLRRSRNIRSKTNSAMPRSW
jgi:hypothetical protein